MALCKNLVVGLVVGFFAVACGGGNGNPGVDDLNEDDLGELCEQVLEVSCVPKLECEYRENCNPDGTSRGEFYSDQMCREMRDKIDNLTTEECVANRGSCNDVKGQPTDQQIQWARICFEDSTADPLECTYNAEGDHDLKISEACHRFFQSVD